MERLSTFWRNRPTVLGTAITQFAILGCGIVSGIGTGRLLGPEGRGQLAVITLWPLLFVFLASVGMNQAITFQCGKKRYSIAEIWGTSLVIGTAQSILVLSLGFPLLRVLLRHYPISVRELGMFFLGAAPVIALSWFPVSVLQGQGILRKFNLVRALAPCSYAIGVVALLILRRPSLTSVVALQAFGFGAALVVATWFLYQGQPLSVHWRPQVAKDLLSYGFRAHLANLTSYLNQRVDQLILSLLIPAEQLGLYAAAVSLAMMVSSFPQAAGLVTFARGSGQSEAEARRTMENAFRTSLAWLLLACTGLFFAAPYLITTLLGASFAGSIVACRWLLPGMIAVGLNQVLYNGANALGKPGLPTYAEGAGLAVTAAGLMILVPRYGYLGAAVVSSAAYIVSFAAMVVLSTIYLKVGVRELFFRLGDSGVKRTNTMEAGA